MEQLRLWDGTMRTHDPRSRWRRNTGGKVTMEYPMPRLGQFIMAGIPRCHFCDQPATEITMPYGHPVCVEHGDARVK